MTEPILPPPINDVQPQKPKPTDRLLVKFGYLGIIVAFLALITIFYWAIIGGDAISVQGPLRVEPDSVKTGQTITVKSDMCKKTNASGRVIKRLVSNTQEIFLPTTTDETKKGCYTNVEDKNIIPQDTPAGTYRVYYRMTYQTTPITNVPEDFYSEPFVVTK